MFVQRKWAHRALRTLQIRITQRIKTQQTHVDCVVGFVIISHNRIISFIDIYGNIGWRRPQ